MDEQGWMTSTDPESMVECLYESGKASGRKVRLFAVACCRRIWRLLADERSRRGVEALERDLEGGLPGEEVRGLLDAAGAASAGDGNDATDAALAAASLLTARVGSDLEYDTVVTVILAASHAPGQASSLSDIYDEEWSKNARPELAAQADLLRCIFGNPFRVVRLEDGWFRWREGTIPKLAAGIYEERHLPSGTLDPGRLSVMADAMEEAGCTDPDILGRLRGPGPHVRGCWVVDCLMKKV